MNNLDVIQQGWLVKSPPEKKSQGGWTWKLVQFFPIQAKWRRRYFVLHKPRSSLPGHYALDYYTNESLKDYRGSIDLEQCQQIVSSLDSSNYEHLFAVRTKHKGRDRTYYLASQSEAEMNKWVQCICGVCGLKLEDDEEDALPPPSIACELPVRQAEPLPVTTHDHLAPVPTHSGSPKIGFSNMDAHSNISLASIRTAGSDPYVPLADCYTGKQKDRTSTGSDVSKPLLDGVPPPVAPRERRDSVPDSPAPLPPPDKGRGSKSLSQFGQEYDYPTQSYKTHTGGDEEKNSLQRVPPARQSVDDVDSLYKIPPTRYGPGWQLSKDENYDIPPSRAPPPPEQGLRKDGSMRDSNSSNGSRTSVKPSDSAYATSDEAYDTPTQRYNVEDFSRGVEKKLSLRTRVPRSGTVQGATRDMYDHPPQRSFSEHATHEQGSRRLPKLQMQPLPVEEEPGPYINLPLNSKSYGQSIYKNQDEAYDFPKQRDGGDGLMLSPPPPHPGNMKKHSYANAASAFVDDGSNEFYLKMQGGATESTYMHMNDDNNIDLRSSVPVQGQRISASYTDMQGENGKGPTTDSLYSVPPPNPKPVNDGEGSPPPIHRHLKSWKLSDTVPPRTGQVDNAYVMPPPNPQPVAGGGPPPPVNRHLKSWKLNDPVPALKAPVPPSRQETSYVIAPSHKTRSFKKENHINQPPREIPLPMKKAAIEECSSDDDDTDGSTDGRRPSNDHVFTRPQMYDAPPIMSIHSTPPPPKKCTGNGNSEVQYLDLDLEKDSDDPERSPIPIRSPTTGNVSPTDYKEIDFVKTMALSETIKDVESKRKSSDKDG